MRNYAEKSVKARQTGEEFRVVITEVNVLKKHEHVVFAVAVLKDSVVFQTSCGIDGGWEDPFFKRFDRIGDDVWKQKPAALKKALSETFLYEMGVAIDDDCGCPEQFLYEFGLPALSIAMAAKDPHSRKWVIAKELDFFRDDGDGSLALVVRPDVLDDD